MNLLCRTQSRRIAGFTLVDAIVGLMLMSLIAIIVIQSMLFAQGRVSAGRTQVQYNNNARISSQKIFDIVYHCNRLAPPVVDDGTKVRLFFRHDADTYEDEGVIEFVNPDGNLYTQEDNYIRYDPDINDRVIEGKEEILARNVSPIPGKPIFSVFRYANGLNSLKCIYHIGDAKSDDFGHYSKSGFGYQGAKVDLAVAPRSLKESVKWDQALGRQAAR